MLSSSADRHQFACEQEFLYSIDKITWFYFYKLNVYLPIERVYNDGVSPTQL